MKKNNLTKRFFGIILSLIIFMSPVFVSGCTWFNFSSNNTNSTQTPQTPSGGTGGSGSGGSHQGGSGDNDNPTNQVYDPPKENELSLDDYNDYFQNYRITYVPGNDASRSSFYESLKSQNQSIAISLLDDLYYEYGDKSSSSANPKFKGILSSIQSTDNKYLSYFNGEQYIIVKVDDSALKYFTHENAINDNGIDTSGNYVTWLWNTYKDSDLHNLEKPEPAEKDDFASKTAINKLTLAAYLILSGETLNEDGTGSFVDKYKSYFENNDVSKNIKSTYLDGEKINISSIEDLLSKIDHLGFTQDEQKTLKNYILNYVIGKDLVQEDNKRFVNAYYDGSNIQVVYHSGDVNSKYDKFLTDETYATVSYDGGISFDFVDGDKKLEGVEFYSLEYLKLGSQNALDKQFFSKDSFYLDGYVSSNSFSGAGSTPANVSPAVYDALINAYGSKVRIDANGNPLTDKDGNILHDFNANVWGYDANQNTNSLAATNTVEYRVGGNTYSLFSLRLPYFKNYYNTISFIVQDMFGELSVQKKQELDAEWQASRNMDYPYDSAFPTVPYSYFCDLNTDQLLIDSTTGDIDMSGIYYQSYQSMVVMPNKPIFIKDASFIIAGPEDIQTSQTGFNLTLYARFYDAETKQFAHWETENGISEFYKVNTITVPFNSGTTADSLIDVDVKNILASAIVNGATRDTYLLPAFDSDNQLVENEELISINNYGYWFKTSTTPDGNDVVCYDGKSAGSPSYLEFIFYVEGENSFMFNFVPVTCFEASEQ